jgi:pSer/pThr/pTyr-binding forkhead associated (FHA) protein
MTGTAQILLLQVTLKGRELKTYRFQNETITIGRNPKSDVCLDNPGISWDHAVLERGTTLTYRVSDCDSANGIFLNGKKIRKAFLRDGDLLSLAKYTIQIGFDEDRRQKSGPFSSQTTEVDVEPPETYALTTGELRGLLAQGLAAQSENRTAEVHVVQDVPAPELDERHPLWAYVVHVLQAERGPILVAFALGLLLGTVLTRCVS